MTREEAKKYLPIIQAYIDGKQIQWLDETGRWHDTNDKLLTFYSPPSNYRIKPETKYRPFKTQQECWEEMHKHPNFGWIMAKDKKELVQIGSVLTSMLNNVMIALSIDEGHKFNSSYYFKNYTFADGTPFGIKEE